MSLYKYERFLKPSDHAEFDKEYSPGDKCPNSGIWRCPNCGDEIAANKGDPLPPQNHHQHSLGAGPIRWTLTVFAQQK